MTRGKQAAPTPAPRVVTVDAALVAHAMRSAPEPAPKPLNLPMGVEALSKVTDAERVRANDMARTIAFSEGELTSNALSGLRAWSGEGGLGGSTSAFYTPRALVQFMWDLSTLLAPAGRALEFSCGSGAFIAQAPQHTLVTGVEIDETSARIAQALFPHAAIHHAPFEQYAKHSEDPAFPLVIGNVPFGVRGASAREHHPRIAEAHWYFTLIGLTRVMPGGLMSVIVPESMLRNPSEQGYREQLIDEAQILTASAIPQEAFTATGAGVTTVLLVLRRHDAGVVEALAELTKEERTKVRDARLANDSALKLFVEGQSVFKKGAKDQWELGYTFRPLAEYRANAVREGRFGQPEFSGRLLLDETSLDALVTSCKARWHSILTRPGLEAAIHTHLGEEAASRAALARPALHPVREGTLSECKTYRFRAGRWTYDTALNHPETLSALRVAQAATHARNAARRGMSDQIAARDQALSLHETHLGTYGAYDLMALSRAAATIPVLNVLVKGGGDVPGLFADLVTPKLNIPTGTLQETAQHLEAYGLLDEKTLMAYSGLPEAVVLAHLLAEYAFTGRVWEANSSYYEGQAYRKAAVAEKLADDHSGPRRAALLAQAERLRLAAPWRDVADMSLEARDPLIPLSVLNAWVNSYLGTTINVKRNRWDTTGEDLNLVLASRNEYRVSLKLRNTLESGASLANRQQVDSGRVRVIEAYLNFQTPVDPVTGQDFKTEEVINAERNANQLRAVRMERDLAGHFRSFVLQGDAAPLVEAALNEGRYGLIPATPDHRPLTLPAYRGPLAHPFQAAHARRAARMDGVILNFGVGLGKTYTGFMLAALLKQSGRSRLPALVVPLSRLGDWVMNATTAVPGLRTLVIGGNVQHGANGQVSLNEDGEPEVREDSGAQRRAKVASILTDAPDLVIFSAEAFEAIGMLEETRLWLIESEASLMSGAATATTFDDRARKLGGHREAVAHERCLQKNMGRVRVSTSTEIPFEALGIDAVIADEAHLFKSVFGAPRVYGESNPKFLGAGGESNRALDAHQKFRYIRRAGGSVTLLTASWFTNSPLEIFNMISLVTDALPGYGVTDVEAFTARFCVIEPRLITLPDGEVEFKSCVVGFRNRDELSAIIGQHVIRETEETCLMHEGVGMPLPPLQEVEHLFDLAPEVQDAYDEEQASVASAESKGEQHLFSIFARMMKLTLHPPLLGLNAPNARFAACVQACMDARARGGRNVVFMYMGGQNGETYRALKSMLVAAGYPEREIEVITGSTHPVPGDRLKVERRLRRGELTCVIGSSVIEQGGNYQGCTDLHHLDYPHHYEAFKQRIGRARRQGTWVTTVYNHVYFARGSFDVIRYQTMLGKKGWADQVYDPALEASEHGGLGFDGEEVAVMLSRDPQATRAAIRAKRESRAAEGRAATLLQDMDVVREYLDTVSLLDRRWRDAARREKGPSVHDVAGINRLVTSLRGLHAQVGALRAAGHPMVAVTRLTLPLAWQGGLPLHVGMSFTAKGQAYRVTSARNGDVEFKATNLADDQEELLKVEVLGGAVNVLPTREESAFGVEAFERLPEELRVRIEEAQSQPVKVAQVEALEAGTAALEAAVSPAPLRLRYGLSVTAAARPVQAEVFSVQGDVLLPGEVPGATLLLIEYRAERDVRKVTLVIPDGPRLVRARQMLHAQDPKLRGWVDVLLQTVI